MISLATAAYADHNEVNAYRLNSITTSSIARFAAPKITIILIFEKKQRTTSRNHIEEGNRAGLEVARGSDPRVIEETVRLD